MSITYFKVKLPSGFICAFKCTTPLQKFRIMCDIHRSKYELIDTITIKL